VARYLEKGPGSKYKRTLAQMRNEKGKGPSYIHQERTTDLHDISETKAGYIVMPPNRTKKNPRCETRGKTKKTQRPTPALASTAPQRGVSKGSHNLLQDHKCNRHVLRRPPGGGEKQNPPSPDTQRKKSFTNIEGGAAGHIESEKERTAQGTDGPHH